MVTIMEQKTISVARGLSELKTLNARIERGINGLDVVTYKTGKKIINPHKSEQEFSEQAKSGMQSALDLIEQRKRLKSAIVQSNATTTVEIGGVKYTVAEAIERKSSIVYEKSLLSKLTNQYAKMLNYVDHNNTQAQARLDKQIEVMLGKEAKNNPEDVKKITEYFMQENASELIDPLNVKQQIEDLSQSIENFESEVDHVLTTSNVMTMITV